MIESRGTNLYCQYCFKENRLTPITGDADFCSATHRKKFHQRLRTILGVLDEAGRRVPRSAAAILVSTVIPVDAFSRAISRPPAANPEPARYSGLFFDRMAGSLEPQGVDEAKDPSILVDLAPGKPLITDIPSLPHPAIPIASPVPDDSRLRRIARVIGSLRGRQELREAAV
jgi:hypothetical protein